MTYLLASILAALAAFTLYKLIRGYGIKAGFSAGYEEGHRLGKLDGHDCGYTVGYNLGKTDGLIEGWARRDHKPRNAAGQFTLRAKG